MVENPNMVPQDMQNLPLEEALKELEHIVRRMEEGRMPLADSVVACERGAQLMNYCHKLIEQTRSKVDEILKLKDGDVTIQPSELQQGF